MSISTNCGFFTANSARTLEKLLYAERIHAPGNQALLHGAGDDFIIFYNHNSIHGCSSVVSSKADIRNPLRYLLDSVKNIDSGRVFSTHSRSRSRFRR